MVAYSKKGPAVAGTPAPTAAHKHPLNYRSTVEIGTAYENLCAFTLPVLGFHSLVRTGGRSDRGIDLLGYWLPPSLTLEQSQQTKGIPVVIQCKSHNRKPGPEWIREIEGAVAGAPEAWQGPDTMGVLCAKREVTAGVRQAIKRSYRGVIWVMIEDSLELGLEQDLMQEGQIMQMFWNEKVASVVGEDLGPGAVYTPTPTGTKKAVRLVWKGRLWETRARKGGDEGEEEIFGGQN